MNQLSTQRRAQVISLLVDGMSIRDIVRITGVAKNTVVKLLEAIGPACADYQDKTLRNLDSTVFECDEIWQFCYSKQKNVPDEFVGTFGYGDVWTWVAIDAESKLVPSWLVGERTNKDAYFFLSDLKSRLKNRVQLTTDGHQPYLPVIELLFGHNDADYAMLIKIYGTMEGPHSPEQTYSPAQPTGIETRVVMGEPDPNLISTSYVERQNLTMRMGMRRFTRLTNAFSKKVENHAHAVSLHFMHYNFARPHMTLTKSYGRPTTPAMAAGKADHVWSTWEIAELLESPRSI
jgi:IS1 family transposase